MIQRVVIVVFFLKKVYTLKTNRTKELMKTALKIITCLYLLSISSFPFAADVAIYFDAAYVDTASEANNLRTTLTTNGDTVTNITGTTGVFAAALTGKNMLVFPEFETGDLDADLDAPTRTNIFNFVNGGGTMVVHGGTNPTNVNIINSIFGYTLTRSGIAFAGTSSLTAAAATSDFSGAPPTIDNLSATTLITETSVAAIANSTQIYKDGTSATVFTVDVGAGKLIFMGWDWFNAPPEGPEDGNWLTLYSYISTNVAGPVAAPVGVSATPLTW